MATRAAFLSDVRHRIQFVYVPKHTSWLNQVEIWFSILMRRVLKRGNVASGGAFGARILACIDYFNQTPQPFKWVHTGVPLVASTASDFHAGVLRFQKDFSRVF